MIMDIMNDIITKSFTNFKIVRVDITSVQLFGFVALFSVKTWEEGQICPPRWVVKNSLLKVVLNTVYTVFLCKLSIELIDHC